MIEAVIVIILTVLAIFFFLFALWHLMYRSDLTKVWYQCPEPHQVQFWTLKEYDPLHNYVDRVCTKCGHKRLRTYC